MTRKYNFCAGPAALPEVVLNRAKDELLDWHGAGLSVMEMSHRSKEVISVVEKAEQDLRDLMAIPDNYKVLFVQGGASTQFSAIPLNLCGSNNKADYLDSGQWSKKSTKEAKRFADVNVVADGADSNYAKIPPFESWNNNKDAAYLHYAANETIGGLEFHWVPKVDVPLVVDMSSTILSRPINVSDYGVIYAGAQKNIGPAGLTLVIVRDDLLDQQMDVIPTMLSWRSMAENDSMLNTPPTFAIYLAGLVFEWLKEQGGLSVLAERNQRKAQKLYDFIDSSPLYANPVEKQSRSWMNVPFTLDREGEEPGSLDKAFLQGAEEASLLNLKGHRSVGGMRASIYNAVTEDAVDALIGYMQDFATSN